ncbi:MAG: HAMP domain-containing histidine kinase [Lachnospiraceae bacterium]|jgi:signal transduction histidine kinase|nr:HAMP domain-containing histidine kinase [Lachnospiraceae bacterium]
MEDWLWVVIGILVFIMGVLVVKIYLLQKAAREIKEGFADRLITDTNTLIDISSHDKYMRELANTINIQLRKLRADRHRFQQGDMELKNAVSNISHDLRTPLTAICGYLDLLEQEEKSTTVERYIEVIRNRTEILKQLIEELFRYSVIITTEDDITKEAVEINRVLEESIAAFYVALNERKIIPSIKMPESKVICYLDGSALARVFSNLLNNAIKYSDGDLDIILSETGEIIFSNTASGLNEVQVGKLFDRFYTVEAARKSTGLGLAIAKTLVEQMNGTISAKYENNRLSICILFSDIYN